jgi:PPP4R2
VSVAEMTATLRSSILNTLRSDFSAHPPYTIQRLAELILWPKREYRFLPPYLAAVNRVVSVSSNTSIFPLPQASDSQTGTLLNGISRLSEPALGSDESLGGALLTPIPWLTRNSPTSDAERELQATAQRLQEQQGLGNNAEREPQLHSESTEMVQGPNGAGRVETVSVVNGGILSGGLPTLGSNSLLTAAGPAPLPSGNAQLATQPLGIGSPPSQNMEMALRAEGAVTQGELLRLEQQAGIVPVPHRTPRLSADELAMESEDMIVDPVEGREVPHARGPEEIGVEDTGLQTGHGGVEGLREGSDRRSSDSPAERGQQEEAEHDTKAGEDS